MNDSVNVLFSLIELVILIGSFLMGKYVFPNIPKETIDEITAKINIIVEYADKFVAWAKQFMSNATGQDKMNEVVKRLITIAERYDLDITEDEIRAIAQKAYDNMKAADDLNDSMITKG